MSLVSSSSATDAYFAANAPRPASPLPPTHSLRILLVDDNHINLSVLSTLLNRRFGHALARPPVSLDSGLKALQLLRTQIFDLIFMDIEMPYLDGVECTRRIRAGEDGILAANRNAHVVAVTTNVGPEPAALYRHVGMDGMISKPVRFQNFQQYLCPLSIEAQEAKGCVTPVLVGTEHVLPPLPPIDLDQRLFFVPSANGGVVTTSRSIGDDCASPTTEYSSASEFAAMLKAQTSKSLRDRKALSVSRSATLSQPRRSSFSSPRSEHLALVRPSSQSSADGTVSDQGEAHDDSNVLSFQSLVERETWERELDSAAEKRTPVLVRPGFVHRASSPAYLLDASPTGRIREEAAMHSTPDLVAHHAVRPDIRPLSLRRVQRTDSDGSANSASDSAALGYTTSSSSAWSSTPLSSDYTTTTQRSASLDLLSGLSCHRATSPSSVLTTPASSPAGMDAAGDGKSNDSDDDMRKAVYSPCADDLLRHSDAPELPSYPFLSRQPRSLHNSPRIRGCGASEDQDTTKRELAPRLDALQLDTSPPQSQRREVGTSAEASF